MKAATPYRLVLVTAPDLKTARKLAQAALRARLIACANLLPRIESHFRWQNRIERSAEALLILKTAAARVRKLEQLILALHPYDTPEFLVLTLTAGNAGYLDWLGQSCGRH